jgi:hypothetical protein
MIQKIGCQREEQSGYDGYDRNCDGKDVSLRRCTARKHFEHSIASRHRQRTQYKAWYQFNDNSGWKEGSREEFALVRKVHDMKQEGNNDERDKRGKVNKREQEIDV